MKRIVTLIFSVITVLVMSGAVQSDSLKVFFTLNNATVVPAKGNDSVLMGQFIDSLAVAAGSATIDSIVVYGYASPDGPFLLNSRLAARRAAAVADYISRHAQIDLTDIRTCSGGVAWDGLRSLVGQSLITPDRQAVLQILDRYLPNACTDADLSRRCAAALKAIDGGQTYKWLLANLFPQLRFALVVYTSNITSPEDDGRYIGVVDVDIDETSDTTDQVIAITDTVVYTGTDVVAPAPVAPLHRLAIKTNLLYDAALLPNLEVEYRVNDRWSVALEGGVAWWGKYSAEHSYRLAMVSPEVRRWFLTRAPWHGLYVGAFAAGGLYDFEKPGRGWRGEGVMGGLSVGYMWPVSRCLSFEAALGAGYLYSRYKQYVPIGDHHVYQRTKDLNYFGPLKLKFSIVWRLWDANRSHRAARLQSNEDI